MGSQFTPEAIGISLGIIAGLGFAAGSIGYLIARIVGLILRRPIDAVGFGNEVAYVCGAGATCACVLFMFTH